jgi:hypothetical protein
MDDHLLESNCSRFWRAWHVEPSMRQPSPYIDHGRQKREQLLSNKWSSINIYLQKKTLIFM